jgi:hypothetical protein
MDRLLADLRAGKVSGRVVCQLDRLCRTTAKSHTTLFDELRALGVNLTGDTGKCPFRATAQQPAQSAFPYVTLVESTRSGKLDASVPGAALSAERGEPT